MTSSKSIAIQRLLARLLLTLMTVGLLAAPSAADIYRWRDDQGRMHFSDSPHNVPEQLRGQIKADQLDPDQLKIISSAQQTENGAAPTSEAQTAEPVAGDSLSIPFTAKEGLADRVIIDITFNGGITAPILLDTGSPGLVLSTDLASRLGLIDPDGNNLLVLISGIGGSKVAAKAIVDRLTIGAITEKFIPAHIIPGQSGAYQGLIGMDILSQYSLTIDSANRRLVADKLPPSENRPAGRPRSWWQKNFRELAHYTAFWNEQAELIDSHNSPYSRLTSRYDRVKSFILQQRDQSQKLYDQLERYARDNAVPRHWRR